MPRLVAYLATFLANVKWATLVLSSSNSIPLQTPFQANFDPNFSIDDDYNDQLEYDNDGCAPHNPVKGAFLHITDIHPDESYLPGATVSSSCHRLAEGEEEDKDERRQRTRTRREQVGRQSLQEYYDPQVVVPFEDGSGVAGVWGTPGTSCDSPFQLANGTLDWAGREFGEQIDFVIWTGDNARHDSDRMFPRSEEEIASLNEYISSLFLTSFPPSVPIIPSIGNNDVYPHNILRAGPNPTINRFLEMWQSFIPEDQLHIFRQGGYFVRDVVPHKIAAISLNTLYFYSSNTAVNGCRGRKCPGNDHLAWLEVTLKLLRKRKMRAILSGHVAPTVSMFYPRCLAKYTNLVLRFRDVIIAQLFGHANVDHFFFLEAKAADVVNESGLGDDDGDDDELVLDVTSVDSSFDAVETTEDEQTVSVMGKSYVDALLRSYERIPRNAGRKGDDTLYSVVHVSPSVIPTYNPSLRVYSYYNGTSPKVHSHSSNTEPSKHGNASTDHPVRSRSDQVDMIPPSSSSLSSAKPRYGDLTDYTQYYMDLQTCRHHDRRSDPSAARQFPGFEVEYVARQAYPLGNPEKPSLHVEDWLQLGRRISRNEKLREIFLDNLTVRLRR